MRRSAKFDNINVVPFIDIMLVLLVIVLTTASFIQTGLIKLDLPTGSSKIEEQPKKELKISIKENGDIYFDQDKVAQDAVEKHLLTHDKKNPIHLYSDKNAKFDNFVFILDILKKHEYENLGIITKK
ncbi:MAG: Biopolymer transport protein ExbD/TolR [uncultured Sulfurovum sp.]|uniref:Biopolymer transport protein ExbD n=1 Tax=uncultured Sulfurovum sp. TaxID=269237 RepID=A0A6S6RVX0_9BACT|nr:MAG: Biopolymer transport protein ExbD/TolR [uncultured Sulfurovum sp.]